MTDQPPLTDEDLDEIEHGRSERHDRADALLLLGEVRYLRGEVARLRRRVQELEASKEILRGGGDDR